MFWSLSFQLLPDEEIIDDSTKRSHSGIKSAYSVFLTNKRAIFRFDGLGSSMTQSFFYEEILDVKLNKRLFVNYIQLRTKNRDFLLNTSEPDYWTNRILNIKKTLTKSSEAPTDITASSSENKKRELLDMLTILRKNSLLTDKELEEKVQLLDSMKF